MTQICICRRNRTKMQWPIHANTPSISHKVSPDVHGQEKGNTHRPQCVSSLTASQLMIINVAMDAAAQRDFHVVPFSCITIWMSPFSFENNPASGSSLKITRRTA